MDVNYAEYMKRKNKFLKQLGDYTVKTSSIDQLGIYHKQYAGETGSWHEVMTPVEEDVSVNVTVHNIEIPIHQVVKFQKTEFWSSEDSTSNNCYELW